MPVTSRYLVRVGLGTARPFAMRIEAASAQVALSRALHALWGGTLFTSLLTPADGIQPVLWTGEAQRQSRPGVAAGDPVPVRVDALGSVVDLRFVSGLRTPRTGGEA